MSKVTYGVLRQVIIFARDFICTLNLLSCVNHVLQHLVGVSDDGGDPGDTLDARESNMIPNAIRRFAVAIT